MKITSLVIALLLTLLPGMIVSAHPGSGIVIDKDGNIYFTDTGKGVWKIDKQNKLIYFPGSRFHWMAIDEAGNFSATGKSFGEYFERATPLNTKPAVMTCSDFPFVVNHDGNIYYARTQPGAAAIIKRTPAGVETVFLADKVFEFVSGITVGPDSALYITEASHGNANTIRKVTMNKKMSIIATFHGNEIRNIPYGSPAAYCRGLSVDATGNIYVAATGSRSILKITPQGIITTILQETGSWSPTGITLFKGEVYILEWHDVATSLVDVREAWIPRIQKIDSNGRLTTIATISR
ncbi:MAG TPA: hypothetical protein VLJ68_09950 [Chitinophagaceae bacterium]|nr:hypothetical protein [Chitinophagaceae bacterium]